MNWEQAAATFMNGMVLRNYSRKTCEETRKILTVFLRFFAKEVPEGPAYLSAKTVQAYLEERHYTINRYGRQNAERTRNNERLALKHFLTFLFNESVSQENLGRGITYLREPQYLPKDILMKGELKKLFSLPDITRPEGARDRVILELLYATGMRRAELAYLKVKDVNLVQKTVFIEQGKGQKDRLVPINDTCAGLLDRYIRVMRPALVRGCATDRLIVMDSGLPLARAGYIFDVVKKYVKRLRLKKKITVHSFRHTCATHMLQNGMPLTHVQTMLGHAQLEATVRYVQLQMKELQREYRRCHPREKKI